MRVLRWLKAPGAEVAKGERLLGMETDKVNVEIEAPERGRLSDVNAREGDFVKFGAVVAVIDMTG